MVKQDLVMQSQNKLKYIFVGNRKFVLEEMLMLTLDLQVLVVKNTHLEKDQILKKVNHKIIQSKDELIEYINNNEFDILLSNGCPFILPISKLKKNLCQYSPISSARFKRDRSMLRVNLIFKRWWCHLSYNG